MKSVFVPKKNNLVKNPLFLNGIGRAGKFFLGKIASGFEDVEYFQYVSILEHLPYMQRLGTIDEDAALCLLQINVNEHAYNMFIGRNINLRFDDASAVHHSQDSERYLERGKRPISENIAEKIQNSKRMPSFILHESMPNINIFFKAFSNMKWINLIRNPIDIVHSWHRKGWGTRFVEDPLSFVPLARKGKHLVPWFVYNCAEKYTRMSPMDRIIECIYSVNRMGKKAYKSLSQEEKQRVLFVKYENLVEKPNEEVNKMTKFLNTIVSNRMKTILKNERCPNVIDPKERDKKLDEIRKLASKTAVKKLLELSSEYQNSDMG